MPTRRVPRGTDPRCKRRALRRGGRSCSRRLRRAGSQARALLEVAGATSSDGTRHRSTLPSGAVPDVVIVSDAASVRDEVRSAITDPDATVRELEAGKQLLA